MKLFKLYGCLQVGDESYESYSAEREGILSSLAIRAKVSGMKQYKNVTKYSGVIHVHISQLCIYHFHDLDSI